MRKIFNKLKNSVVLQIGVFTVLMSCFTVIYLIIGNRIHKRYEIVEDDFSWVYQIDGIEETEGELVISGWAFKADQNAKKGKCEILLYEVSTGEAFYPMMSYREREDVNRYFSCEYDYTQSGFTGTISVDKLDLDNQFYEILLRPEDNRKVYATGVYYAEGEMMFINPTEYIPLQVNGTDLEQIVRDGALRVYRPDYGMYVYQYNKELYWIAEEWYGFSNDDTIVEFNMNTTQIERLPEENLLKELLWSNISFWFTSKEILGQNFGRYRVAKCALPEEYSITRIWTGNCYDNWVWKQDFRPYYDFIE